MKRSYVRATRQVAVTVSLAVAATLGLALTSGGAHAATGCGPAPTVNHNSPATNQAPTPQDDVARVQAGRPVEIPVLLNDTDPDGDTLALVSAGRPDRGQACATAKGTIRYTPQVTEKGYTTTFAYGVTDGDRYRSARVTVSVAGLQRMTATVRGKLQVRKDGTVRRPARVAITNPNSERILLIGGDVRRDQPQVQRYLAPGQTAVVRTKARRFAYVAVLESADSVTFVNAGMVNTRNGRHRTEYIGESLTTDEGLGFRTAQTNAWARAAR